MMHYDAIMTHYDGIMTQNDAYTTVTYEKYDIVQFTIDDSSGE